MLPSLIGFDAEIIERMEQKQARRLRNLLRWYFAPCVCMGASGGLFLWLVEGSVVGALLLAGAIGLMVLNLLRLLVAGGGAAPHWSEARAARWTPTLPPLLILGGLAACFAQPVQLAAFSSLVDQDVEQYRAQLLSEHADVQALTTAESYRQRLDDCYFATYRLSVLWHHPERPLLFTFVFCGVALLPLLLGHTTHLGVLRAYELLRWQDTRHDVLTQEHEHQLAVHAALSHYRLFAPGPLPKIAQAPHSTASEETS